MTYNTYSNYYEAWKSLILCRWRRNTTNRWIIPLPFFLILFLYPTMLNRNFFRLQWIRNIINSDMCTPLAAGRLELVKSCGSQCRWEFAGGGLHTTIMFPRNKQQNNHTHTVYKRLSTVVLSLGFYIRSRHPSFGWGRRVIVERKKNPLLTVTAYSSYYMVGGLAMVFKD